MPGYACVPTDLGGFTMCVPENWTLNRHGTDSSSGMFSGDGIRIGFDFGLYSDPLTLPDDATRTEVLSRVIAGLPARQVSYTHGSIDAVGIHFPNVRSTGMGPIKLTVLAQARDAAKLKSVDKAFATIRFKAARP